MKNGDWAAKQHASSEEHSNAAPGEIRSQETATAYQSGVPSED